MSERAAESAKRPSGEEFAIRLAALHEAVIDGSSETDVSDQAASDPQLLRAKQALELLERVRCLPGEHRQETSAEQSATPICRSGMSDVAAGRSSTSDESASPASPERAISGGKPAVSSVQDTLTHIDHYEILGEIARGGMGVVFRARDTKLDRVVALKMMLAGPFALPEERQRFRIEAEAAAQLDHPSIVPVFDVAEYENLPYFTMGFVEGESLSACIQREPFEPRVAAKIAKVMCDALDYAHQRGVVHRDIKPLNVLIDQTGQPRITDFGLARRTDTDSELTGTGQVLGTPSYMAPELAAGRPGPVAASADIYSVGGTLYCMLTGRPPFQAASTIDTLRLVTEQEPISPRQLNPTIPTDLATICLKCLHKEPLRRYSSAAALGADLDRYIRGEPIDARPAGRLERVAKWSRRHPLVALLSMAVSIALLALIVGGAWYQSRLAAALDQTEDERAKVADALYTSLTNEADFLNQTRPEGYGPRVWRLLEQAGALDTPSRDPRQLRQLAVSSLGHLAARDPMTVQTEGSRVTAAHVTSDGQTLFAGLEDGQLLVFDLQRQQVTQRLAAHDEAIVAIEPLENDRLRTWSCFYRSLGIWKRRTDGAWMMASLERMETPGFLGLRATPDGSRLVGITGLPADACRAAEWETTLGAPSITGLAAWFPKANSLASGRFTVRQVSAGGSAEQDEHTTAPLHDIPLSLRFDACDTHLVVAYSWLDRELWEQHGVPINTISIYDIRTGAHQQTVDPRCGAINSVRISRDGRLIACGGHIAAAIIDRASGDIIARLDDIGSCGVESFVDLVDVLFSNEKDYLWYSVRQKKLLARFKRTHDGAYMRVSASGHHTMWLGTDHLRFANVRGRERRMIAAHRKVAKTVRFSPDGRLLLSSGGDDTIRLWNAETLERLLEIPGSDAALSPDGKLLAIYNRGCVQFWDVATGSLLGRTEQCVFPNLIRFSPDAEMVAVTGWNKGNFWVWRLDRESETATSGQSGETISPKLCLRDELGSLVAAWSPSGRRLAYRSGAHVLVHDFQQPSATFAIEVTQRTSYQNVVFLSESRLGIADDRFEIWDLDQRQCVRVSESRVRFPIAISPDGAYLLCHEQLLRADTLEEVF